MTVIGGQRDGYRDEMSRLMNDLESKETQKRK